MGRKRLKDIRFPQSDSLRSSCRPLVCKDFVPDRTKMFHVKHFCKVLGHDRTKFGAGGIGVGSLIFIRETKLLLGGPAAIDGIIRSGDLCGRIRAEEDDEGCDLL